MTHKGQVYAMYNVYCVAMSRRGGGAYKVKWKIVWFFFVLVRGKGEGSVNSLSVLCVRKRGGVFCSVNNDFF